MADAGVSGQPELLYVSWGGTGRADTVRQALTRAGATGNGLVYLAVLDDSAFGDLDPALLDVARQELTWLLEAQLELTRLQTNLDDVPVRVLVRAGDVADRVAEVADAVAATQVLIGAATTVATDGAVTGWVEAVRRRAGVPVEVIEP